VSTAGNLKRRDERRERRAEEPGFREREAADSMRYRLRKVGGPIEAIHCARCHRYWYRMRRRGQKPKSCPACRRKTRAAQQRLYERSRAVCVCVRCTEPTEPGRSWCQGCIDYSAALQRARRPRLHECVCRECGQVWMRPALGGQKPHRCPECRA